MIRLRKPTDYFLKKYGTTKYALNKLYLLMEKQHNRGQEGAGVACARLTSSPGEEFMFRQRAEGADAISEVFAAIRARMDEAKKESRSGHADGKGGDADPSARMSLPFVGDIYMGHLRYSTTGRSGITYVHPFLRRSNYRAATMALCGNFNMTNIDELFSDLLERGQHPRSTSDTTLLLEQVGHELDLEIERLRRLAEGRFPDERELIGQIERNLRIERVIAPCARMWDGGFVICGMTGSGETFVLRDPWGIRPAFYHVGEEMVVTASERPVIQTVMNLDTDDIREIEPGEALITRADGQVVTVQVLEPRKRASCSFERIYFSRGSDRDIYKERKGLGAEVVPQVMEAIGGDLDNTVFSFIPNTAENAFYGMVQALEKRLDEIKTRRIIESGTADHAAVASILESKVRIEKVAVKDIKLRTFIAEGNCRDDLAAHVYDVIYGSVRPRKDNLVVIDDSIVRGTTLRRSIVRILARLNPKKLVVVSSSPQIRYPDFYGIDMSDIGSLVAFRAAVKLLEENDTGVTLEQVYRRAVMQRGVADIQLVNCVKAVYEPFDDATIARTISRLVTPDGISCLVEVIFQSIEALHAVCADHTGDWYFSGDYPTPGGTRLVNEAFIRYYESEHAAVHRI